MTESAIPAITALLGCPAAGQPAQFLFERALAAAGLDWRFLTCEVDEASLEQALRGAQAMGFRGCLLTGPLRQHAVGLAEELSPAARFSSAVSRIDIRDGLLFGNMTEGRGAVEAIRWHIEPAEHGVLVLGTDAAAKAVALELALGHASLLILADHDQQQLSDTAESVAGLNAVPVAASLWNERLTIPSEVKILVAATTLDAERAAAIDGFRADMVVVDLQMASPESPLIAAARQHGCCTVDGLDVRCEQAAIDFRAWTGVDADTEVLRDALDEFFSA